MDIAKIVDHNKNKVADSQTSTGAGQVSKSQKNVRVSSAEAAKNSKVTNVSSAKTGSAEKVAWSDDADVVTEGVIEAHSAPSSTQTEKVARLKAAIKSGSYQVDAQKVADKMIESSLEEGLLTRKS